MSLAGLQLIPGLSPLYTPGHGSQLLLGESGRAPRGEEPEQHWVFLVFPLLFAVLVPGALLLLARGELS